MKNKEIKFLYIGILKENRRVARAYDMRIGFVIELERGAGKCFYALIGKENYEDWSIK